MSSDKMSPAKILKSSEHFKSWNKNTFDDLTSLLGSDVASFLDPDGNHKWHREENPKMTVITQNLKDYFRDLRDKLDETLPIGDEDIPYSKQAEDSDNDEEVESNIGGIKKQVSQQRDYATTYDIDMFDCDGVNDLDTLEVVSSAKFHLSFTSYAKAWDRSQKNQMDVNKKKKECWLFLEKRISLEIQNLIEQKLGYKEKK